MPVRGTWRPDSGSPSGVAWDGESPGYGFDKLYDEEYRPYWRPGLTAKQVLQRRRDARAAAPWGGVTWLEDLKYSTAPTPSWWDDAAKQKTLIGHPGKKPGQWNGGHGSGQNIPGKSEFPQRWTDDDIDLVLRETWANPTATRKVGDCRYARRVIDGVLVEVSAYGNSYENYRAYFSIGGRGVFYNDRNGTRIEKRIPRPTDDWEILSG